MKWEDLEVCYVPGPYRSPRGEYGISQNIARATDVGRELILQGKVPLIPHHNTAFFDNAAPDSVWLEGDIVMMNKCKGAYLVDGWENSSGTLKEIAYCLQKGIPIFRKSEDGWEKLEHLDGAEEVELPKMDLVGIIGPYHTNGNVHKRYEDVFYGGQLALELWRTNRSVICPQKNFWLLDNVLEEQGTHTRQKFVYALLDRCDYAVAMPNWAKDSNARLQVEFCKERGMDIYVPDREFVSLDGCIEL